MMKLTYKIAPDHRSITCLICGSVSHNRGDVLALYCARCAVFHRDLEPCPWCDEAVLPGEPTHAMPHMETGGAMVRHWHWECSMRAVIGGLNHQLGKCSCCGGTEPPDPPFMTPRQAALAAVEHFQHHQKLNGCEQKAP
jgi:hypothetical protein